MSNIKSLHKHQMRMILDAMGVPLRQQPIKITEAKSLLEVFAAKSPEKYEYYRTMVVEHRDPDAGEEKKATVIELSDASLMIAEEIELMKNNHINDLVSKVDHSTAKAITAMEEKLAEACERESKKYNTVKHIVKIGNKKQKEMSGVVNEHFEDLCGLATMRKNILMVGPAGCGKTHVAGQIAEALDLPFASQSCSAGVSETAFTGKLLPLGENGKFEYVQSDFVNIYENGGVFLFDEIDASDANVLVFMNQALANEGFYNPSRIGNTYIKKHKDFVAVAAANTFGTGADAMYTARNTLDAATLDRFRIGTIELGYSEAIEEQLVDIEILKFGLAVRSKINKVKLQKICSTRFLKEATELKEGLGWDLQKIAERYFADWTDPELATIGVFSNEQKSQITVSV